MDVERTEKRWWEITIATRISADGDSVAWRESDPVPADDWPEVVEKAYHTLIAAYPGLEERIDVACASGRAPDADADMNGWRWIHLPA